MGISVRPFQKMAILMYVNGDDEALLDLLEAYPGVFHKLMCCIGKATRQKDVAKHRKLRTGFGSQN